ncbi:response regulator receiver protein [Parafrankia sp. EAN1pec]|uniref:response regulator n=1 Tax=Parafrankia sp. (strain EAN1pec) TaxID=298653 RepID=UPI0000543543|nr:response regulator receiver protein [Frankia sp. EAN1pec]
MGDAVQLLKAISDLLGVVVWPALFFFVVIRFRSSFAELFSNLAEFTVKAPGIEASASRQQIEAAASLGAAAAEQRVAGESGSGSEIDARAIADALPDARIQRRLIGSLVLWVDDRPSNNLYERHALESLGVRFVLATSTDEALSLLKHQSFDMIISDMGHPDDPRAGYTLLDRLRVQGDRTPFFIYAASRAPEHVRESREHGAIGCTNLVNELTEVVTSTLASQRSF